MNTGISVRSRCIAVAIALIVASGLASAQSYQGAMRGQVRDAQGVIPGVEVTLVNENTNATRTVTANEVGDYSFPSVLPGTYSVRAVLPGFKTEERRGLQVSTQASIVQDFRLEVGALSEQITVTAETPLLERANATRATTMSAELIASLPIFGRNTFISAISTPSVIQTGDPQFVRYQDQSNGSLLSLGGGPRRGNAYLLEGVSITDFINRPSWVPSTEAIEDMRVQVKTYDAEMGRAAGGVFNVTARSGSNAWRGSALFLNKPGWATGTLFFAKLADIPNPKQYYYSWAGSLGGPIKKDKTFFWFRVIRTTVGLRPHRDSGFVLKAETFDHKTVFHNYGFGGAGMSLAWGTGAMAADMVLAVGDRRAAVLGCGSPGLTAARQLQRRGFDVTIYAMALPPYTTSNMSMAGFTPTSRLVEGTHRTPAWDAQGIMLGNLQERGNWSLEPNEEVVDRVVSDAAGFFAGMRAVTAAGATSSRRSAG
jgi:hypothetical protein